MNFLNFPINWEGDGGELLAGGTKKEGTNPGSRVSRSRALSVRRKADPPSTTVETA